MRSPRPWQSASPASGSRGRWTCRASCCPSFCPPTSNFGGSTSCAGSLRPRSLVAAPSRPSTGCRCWPTRLRHCRTSSGSIGPARRPPPQRPPQVPPITKAAGCTSRPAPLTTYPRPLITSPPRSPSLPSVTCAGGTFWEPPSASSSVEPRSGSPTRTWPTRLFETMGQGSFQPPASMAEDLIGVPAASRTCREPDAVAIMARDSHPFSPLLQSYPGDSSVPGCLLWLNLLFMRMMCNLSRKVTTKKHFLGEMEGGPLTDFFFPLSGWSHVPILVCTCLREIVLRLPPSGKVLYLTGCSWDMWPSLVNVRLTLVKRAHLKQVTLVFIGVGLLAGR